MRITELIFETSLAAIFRKWKNLSKSRVEVYKFLKQQQFLGDDLLSHPATRAVPSALTSLTAGFGMGPGVPSSLKSPRNCNAHIKKTNIRMSDHPGLRTTQKPSAISTG
jgi:hypothetical protein